MLRSAISRDVVLHYVVTSAHTHRHICTEVRKLRRRVRGLAPEIRQRRGVALPHRADVGDHLAELLGRGQAPSPENHHGPREKTGRGRALSSHLRIRLSDISSFSTRSGLSPRRLRTHPRPRLESKRAPDSRPGRVRAASFEPRELAGVLVGTGGVSASESLLVCSQAFSM